MPTCQLLIRQNDDGEAVQLGYNCRKWKRRWCKLAVFRINIKHLTRVRQHPTHVI